MPGFGPTSLICTSRCGCWTNDSQTAPHNVKGPSKGPDALLSKKPFHFCRARPCVSFLQIWSLLILFCYVRITQAQFTPPGSSAGNFTAASSPTPTGGLCSTIFCNFKDRAELVDRTAKEHLNVSNLVKDCEEVCFLEYGTGNLDISDVGVRLPFLVRDSSE